jgi:hypothetical protein
MEDDLTFPQIIEGLSAPIATTTADAERWREISVSTDFNATTDLPTLRFTARG